MELTNDILSLAAIVTAYVGVAKGFRLPEQYTHAVALAVAAVFVLSPDAVRSALTEISLVGLTASGAYHFAKKRSDGGSAGGQREG